jgi:hypothetical protein
MALEDGKRKYARKFQDFEYIYEGGSKCLRSAIQKARQMENAARDI